MVAAEPEPASVGENIGEVNEVCQFGCCARFFRVVMTGDGFNQRIGQTPVFCQLRADFSVGEAKDLFLYLIDKPAFIFGDAENFLAFLRIVF